MPISDNLKLIFVHIPKNAGTSITNNKLAEFSNGGHFTAEEIKQRHPKKWEEYFKFAVIRNPWDRVVSNYEYARMEKSYWHSSDNSTPYPPHSDYSILKDMSFEQCVNLLYKNIHSLNHEGWKPQYVWISDKSNNIIIDKFFYYENLENDEDFSKIIPNLDKINLTTKKSNNYKDYYNDDLINKVSEIYKNDIKLFNFNY